MIEESALTPGEPNTPVWNAMQMSGVFLSRRDGKSGLVQTHLAAYLRARPDARLHLIAVNPERERSLYPEDLRDRIDITTCVKPQDPACPQCGVRSRLALEICDACGMSVYQMPKHSESS